MPKTSAGILLVRCVGEAWEVLLAHPGGPFWAKKDDGAWSIPKGEFDLDSEDPLRAAQREFTEETGGAIVGTPRPLTPIKQAGGKIVYAFAVEQDFDPGALASNSFALEWPPKSGRVQEYPEVDRVGWFTPAVARTKLLASQLPLIDELERIRATGGGGPSTTPAHNRS